MEQIPSVIRLIEEAIKEGCLKYQFNVTERVHAPNVFSTLFVNPMKQGNLTVAYEEKSIVGFSAFLESEFCGTVFFDGILTFVSKDFRRKGLSVRMREKSIEGKDLKGKIIRYSVDVRNGAGDLSANSFANKKYINAIPTGVLYEARVH